jgi:hypothetical protein
MMRPLMMKEWDFVINLDYMDTLSYLMQGLEIIVEKTRIF